MRHLLLAACLLAPGLALAKDATLHAPHQPETPTHAVVGAKIATLSMPAEADEAWLIGGGVFGEIPIFHHAMELEGSAALLIGGGHIDVPVDVLLKVPFHLSAHTEAFVGAGPMVAWTDHGVSVGGKASTGLMYWATATFGLMVEADYTLSTLDQHRLHGVETAAGVAWRI